MSIVDKRRFFAEQCLTQFLVMLQRHTGDAKHPLFREFVRAIKADEHMAELFAENAFRQGSNEEVSEEFVRSLYNMASQSAKTRDAVRNAKKQHKGRT